MPWSKDNPPFFAKNKSEAERKVAADAANSTLAKGSTEEEAIFAAIAAVKRLNKQESQKKAVEAPKRVLPSHVSSLLNKAAVEPVISPNEPSSVRVLPISKEFFGENALPVGTDRNLFSVVLKENNKLVHTFDTGEQIVTDLNSLNQVVENHVTISGNDRPFVSPSLTGKFFGSFSTVANQPLVIEHNLGLFDPDAFVINFIINMKGVEVDYTALDSNTIEITTLVDVDELKVSIVSAL